MTTGLVGIKLTLTEVTSTVVQTVQRIVWFDSRPVHNAVRANDEPAGAWKPSDFGRLTECYFAVCRVHKLSVCQVWPQRSTKESTACSVAIWRKRLPFCVRSIYRLNGRTQVAATRNGQLFLRRIMCKMDGQLMTFIGDEGCRRRHSPTNPPSIFGWEQFFNSFSSFANVLVVFNDFFMFRVDIWT